MTIKSQDINKIGIYAGKANNTNWNIIKFGEEIVYMNEDEFMPCIEKDEYLKYFN